MPARPNDNPDLAHTLDHPDRIHDYPHLPAERAAEQTFDQLNPSFGVPADRSDRIGHRDVAQREAAWPWGCGWPSTTAARTTRSPIIWQPGQDYRMADALHAARTQPTRHSPERVGPER